MCSAILNAPPGCGMVFKIGTGGHLTVLHVFGGLDGACSSAQFSSWLGLPPFVQTVPAAAYPGTKIFILGTGLTGATAVSFGGMPATFTVVSATEITATVPKGPCSGKVEVVTPGGTLSSNVPFRVF